MFLGRGRWPTARWPVPWNSRFRPRVREARPSRGYDPSPMGGTTRVWCGRAGMTLRRSLCLPSRTRPRAGAGTRSSSTAGWRSGHFRRRCPWWPTICPESPRFALSFPYAVVFFRVFFVGIDPCSVSPRSSRPGPSGSRSFSGGRGTYGTSFSVKRAILSAPTSSCRHGAHRWRTSAFVVPMRRSRRLRP